MVRHRSLFPLLQQSVSFACGVPNVFACPLAKPLWIRCSTIYDPSIYRGTRYRHARPTAAFCFISNPNQLAANVSFATGMEEVHDPVAKVQAMWRGGNTRRRLQFAAANTENRSSIVASALRVQAAIR